MYYVDLRDTNLWGTGALGGFAVSDDGSDIIASAIFEEVCRKGAVIVEL